MPIRLGSRGRALAVAALTLGGTALAAGQGQANPAGDRDPIPFTPWLDHAGSRISEREYAGSGLLGTVVPALAAAKPRGHDVSSHQRSVDWAAAKKNGAAFVYVKATEATSYKSPYFKQQYEGSRKQGILRGAYHFALPGNSSGKRQAAYFVANGGAWKNDGWTLPPAVDLEYNPYGADCYGLSKAAMTSWIKAFSQETRRLTGRHPVIYTTTQWWKKCTGNSAAFGGTNPLWIARWSTSPGTLPAGWSFWTFWQYDNSGKLPGDQDLFNGSAARLKQLAKG